MKPEPSKNWWQTAAGLMTGVAALLSAIAALIVALAQVGFFSRETSAESALSSDEVTVPSPDPARASRPSKPGTRDTNAARTTLANTSSSPEMSARVPVPLPARREYILGPTSIKARYVLTDATLAQHSAESSSLAIKVRLVAEGTPDYNSRFSSAQFSLAIDDAVVKAQPSFSEYVRSGDSIERYVSFAVPSQAVDVVLRIKVGVDSHAEIPLKLPSVAGDRVRKPMADG